MTILYDVFEQEWASQYTKPMIYSDVERKDAVDRINKTIQKYSTERVKQWNKEIDGLLTFVRIATRPSGFYCLR